MEAWEIERAHEIAQGISDANYVHEDLEVPSMRIVRERLPHETDTAFMWEIARKLDELRGI